MSDYFRDKVVWITGASSGIGEAMAYQLSRAGAKLVISSRHPEKLRAVKEQCVHPEQVAIVPVDLSDFGLISEIGKQVLQAFGQVDILFNNAGISQRELAQNTQISVDQQIMNVNFLGTVAITKAILPDMIRRKKGHIVVMSSVLGKMGAPYRSTYCASKHALHGFFDSLRAEVYPYHIDVTLICPGFVRTNVTINALKGDGTPNNEMAQSTAKGVSPKEFAHWAMRKIARRRKEVYFGGKELIGVIVNRISPSLFARIARKVKLS